MRDHHQTACEIVGISAAVPNNRHSLGLNLQRTGGQTGESIASLTGIREQRRATPEHTVEGLAIGAIETLFSKLDWAGETVDVVIFGTQTSSRHLPGASSQVLAALDFGKGTVSFDYNLGCSAFPYGYWLVSKILDNSSAKRALLITGDVLTKMVDSENPQLAPLFGDAVTVTAIEKGSVSRPTAWSLGSDGRNAELIRSRDEKESLSDDQLLMDGPGVFAFGLREVPQSVSAFLEELRAEPNDIDWWVFHQANQMLLNRLRLKTGVSADKFLFGLERWGNTSGASIPMALIENRQLFQARKQATTLGLVGFGVGLSWASGLAFLGSRAVLIEPVDV